MSEKAVAPLLQATAGAVGSASSNAIIYPLDFLVSRLQTTSVRRGAKKPSVLQTIQRIIRAEGFLAFYRGLVPDTASTFLSNFIYFYVYAFLKRVLSKSSSLPSLPSISRSAKPTDGKPRVFSPAEELAIGMLAGMVSRFCTTPLSNVTVRKQTAAKVAKKEAQGGDESVPGSELSTPAMTPQPSAQGFEHGRQLGDGRLGGPQTLGSKSNLAGGQTGKAGAATDDDSEDEEDEWYEPGVWDVIKEIHEEKGLPGLWSGYKAACILTINPAITFYLFEAFKRAFIPSRDREKPSAVQTFLTSATASAIASALIYPMILIKTRLQWKSPSGRLVYKSASDVVRKTTRRHGVAGMYQGLETQILKGFLNQGLTMVMKQRVEEAILKLG